jgi:ankyrin repeat protein
LVNIPDNEGTTPLLEIARYGSDRPNEILALLLENGAAIEIRDQWGRTPLSVTAGNNCVKNLDLLTKSGAEIESRDNDGLTPLSWATQEYSTESVRYLLKIGAAVNSRDNSGKTPLSLIQAQLADKIWVWLLNERNDIEIERTLLEAGGTV